MSQLSTGLSLDEGSTHGPYLTTEEAARYVNYSVNYFRALVRAGKLPPPFRVGPGGKLIWRRAAIDDHLRALETAQSP
jgi:excisionase family DNA binding protein